MCMGLELLLQVGLCQRQCLTPYAHHDNFQESASPKEPTETKEREYTNRKNRLVFGMHNKHKWARSFAAK